MRKDGGRLAPDHAVSAGHEAPGLSGSPESEEPGEKESDTGVAVEEGRPKLKEPPRFAVFLVNDDYTTMEFVVEVLQGYFHKTEAEALEIMLRVHHEGRGVAGVFTFQIAETKVAQVHEAARTRGFPLRCLIEPIN